MRCLSHTICRPHLTASARRAFTLVELLVVIMIIGTLSSLMLAGLGVARQKTRIARTEVTIRKIHEIILPYYERMLTRTSIGNFAAINTSPNTQQAKASYTLAAQRALQAVELPDGWSDVIYAGANNNGGRPLLEMVNWTPFAVNSPSCDRSAVARRLYDVSVRPFSGVPPASAHAQLAAAPFGSGECLWAIVMRAGFADPGIVGSFRDDEFADPDGNGHPHFVDGWGNPILFLRWAPAFVSRYQPSPSNTAAESHDAFDLQGVDRMARTTLFPLIFSAGPDEDFGISHRSNDGTRDSNGNLVWPPSFAYRLVGYDPYFSPNIAGTERSSFGQFAFKQNVTDPLSIIGEYNAPARQYYQAPFGTTSPAAIDNVHNHSMSR